MSQYEQYKKLEIIRLAKFLGAKLMANGDAHAVRDYCYCNVLGRVPKDERELIQVLKEGAYSLGSVKNF